jgi:broad specificity phosphatase PhoE
VFPPIIALEMQIVLVRHGCSGHTVSGWLDRAAFQRWREAYEAAGIAEGEVPPPSLLATAATALVVASDAPRAIASARTLAPGRAVEISPLLRELDLHPPSLGRLRLPWIGWALAIGFGSRVSAAETERGRAAAEWLASLATAHGSVVAVTHGSVRRLIARELVALGFRGGSRGIRHWSAWVFSRGIA